MYSNLSIFRMAHALAGHAGARQAATAQNIANADTPGFRARDLAPFAETYQSARPSMDLRATRTEHNSHSLSGRRPDLETVVQPGDASPNGNTVSIETEMIRSSEIKYSHDMALSVYRSSMTILRTALGRS